jgi:KR domain
MSAIAGIIGTVSQANYAAGNTYQDALVNYRHANERQVLINVRIH